MPRTRIPTLILLTWVLVAFGGPLTAADEEVARFLLDQAKKAVSARRFDEAVIKLERARDEDPELLEAAYILGQVFEKKKEPSKALGAYRSFRDGCQARGDSLDKKLARLLPRAEKRIAVLGKGEKELDALQSAFAERILEFVRQVEAADPDIAIDALRRLVLVSPGLASAKRMLADLTGEDDLTDDGTAGGSRDSPIPGINAWDDLLRDRAIPAGTNLQYKKKLLTIDQKGGTIFWTDPPRYAPDTYVLEVEFCFLEEYAVGYLLGLAFARDEEVARNGGQEMVMAMALKSSLSLAQASGGRNIDVGESAVPSQPLDAWRRLTVAVEGRKVRVFLDGKQYINTAVPGRRNLEGLVGIFHQRSKVEIRAFRLGTKE